MKNLSLAAACAAALLAAGPAFAASTTESNTSAMTNHEQMQNGQNLRQQLQDQLSKQGFTNIKITPSSFFVEAHNKKGDPVAMVIGPDSFTEVTELGGPNQHASAMTPSQHQQTPAEKEGNSAK